MQQLQLSSHHIDAMLIHNVFQVVNHIENVKVSKVDKPYDDIKILSAEVS
jgi:hypothetical protein